MCNVYCVDSWLEFGSLHFCILFVYIQYAAIFHWFIVSLLQKVIKCMFSFQRVASSSPIIKSLHFIFLRSGP